MTIMQMYYHEKDLEEGSVGWNIVRWFTRRTVRSISLALISGKFLSDLVYRDQVLTIEGGMVTDCTPF